MRDEVLANLAAADSVSVRDRRTLALLGEAGMAARLAPDPAVMVAELFGARIGERAAGGEVARVLAAFPQGHLAVQFSAEFGDDETLDEIAAQLDRAAATTGFGVVLFRAGAAPWHDDLDCLRRVAARMRRRSVQVFESLDAWDVCALIATSRGYCGSSLHGRIVAMAFALPRVSLHRPGIGARAGKQAAYAATWDSACSPATVGVADIAHALGAALATDRQRLRDLAGALAARYREDFEATRAALVTSAGSGTGSRSAG